MGIVPLQERSGTLLSRAVLVNCAEPHRREAGRRGARNGIHCRVVLHARSKKVRSVLVRCQFSRLRITTPPAQAAFFDTTGVNAAIAAAAVLGGSV
jgi:hypothetical protein